MLRSSLLLALLALVAPVFGVIGPDPVPSVVVPCEKPGADLRIGAFLRPNQQLIAENMTWINGPGQHSISYCQVVGSSQQFYSLANGPYDAILTTYDNVVNRQLNGLGNFSVLATLDNTPGQAILGTGEVKSVADLKGKNIITDSSTSGYVLQFRAITADHGLFYENNDYNFVALGGTPIRYAALRESNTTINGQVVPLHATIVGPPQSITWATDSSYKGLNLVAWLDDYVAPLSDIVIAVHPEFYNNATKVAAMKEYLQAMLKGQAFLAKRANRPYVESVFARTMSFTPAQASTAYDQLTSKVDGTLYLDPTLTLGRLPSLNVAYLRQRFGGFNNNQTAFIDLFESGLGRFLDYTLRDAVLPAFRAETALTVNVPASLASKCLYPALGQTYVINNARASIASTVSGGCVNKPVVEFESCVAGDSSASPSQCVYDEGHDSLRIVAATPNLSTGRTYTINWTASDACGASSTIAQTVEVQALTNFRHNGCTRV